jgi:pyruvate dehydrogenase E2 component (dihydrolipoamide acetyltransferase)
MFELRLPQYGMGMDEGSVVAWQCSAGDQVAEGDVLAVVEAAKTETDLVSPIAGTVVALFVEQGESVAVGTPLVCIDPNG